MCRRDDRAKIASTTPSFGLALTIALNRNRLALSAMYPQWGTSTGYQWLSNMTSQSDVGPNGDTLDP